MGFVAWRWNQRLRHEDVERKGAQPTEETPARARRTARLQAPCSAPSSAALQSAQRRAFRLRLNGHQCLLDRSGSEQRRDARKLGGHGCGRSVIVFGGFIGCVTCPWVRQGAEESHQTLGRWLVGNSTERDQCVAVEL